MFSGLYFDSFDVQDVQFRMFDDFLSVKTRVYSSTLCISVYLARFSAASVFNEASDLVMLNTLRSVKVRHSAARHICTAYSRQGRGAMKTADAAAVVALENVDQAASVAPLELASELSVLSSSQRALDEAAAAALRAAGAGGVAGAGGPEDTGGREKTARALLLRALDEALAASNHISLRHTLKLELEIASRWLQEGESRDDGYERILLPRLVPFVVRHSRTIAEAFGGRRLSDRCFCLCRSPSYAFASCVLLACGYTLMVLVLCSRNTDAVAVPALYAVVFTVFLLGTCRAMLLNTEVLRCIVLQQFDTWWSLSNVLGVAIAGAFTFERPTDARIWALSQALYCICFFDDAGPNPRRTRLITAYTCASYACFQTFAMVATWLRVFAVQDYFVDVLGVPVNLRHWCFAAQVNAAILSTRFAVRAVTGHPQTLVFVTGLVRARMPAAEARELRAIVLAEQTVRATSALRP